MWILTTNRAHLRPLEPHERFDEVGTEHQFVLMSAPVEREVAFQEMKSVSGSIFAWHGSGAGNWHVILRTSLKNMSGTKHMSTGQVYGAGIYFASNSSTSLGYCGKTRPVSWKNSKHFKLPMTCLALCEIINREKEFTYYPGKGAAKGKKMNDQGIYVVPQEEYVMTRFLIVNPSMRKVCDAQTIMDNARSQKKLSFLD
uniref:Poly [ADP-ribose] polymerase n=1 Tax=Octactis speculum TaxID=3111310 RepID=A0A7S2FMF6_9STRA